ncbi:hypothetical protein [Yinghuangia soli]|uniref:Uncharacterized protein n=1 Tax=Yinghuangia soli TaxID=2908204 RepID=A0AA41Q5N7_9ACTN|nr:hypothetical protein [Yinghuangia soli]MCF2532013.1 hypothetical protein [Yinghuangia soli]
MSPCPGSEPGTVRLFYAVETEDGSPWRLPPEFLASLGSLRPDMPPRYRSDLPEGTRVRLRTDPADPTESHGEVTGIWCTTPFEPPKGYIVRIGEYVHCATPDEIDLL